MGFFDDDSADNQLTCTTSCSKCKLYQSCKSPNLSSQGSGSNGIMLLLPPPSEEEDNSGIAGTGELNNWLRNELNNLGIEYDECFKVNVIGCYSDKAIKNQHVECCSARLEAIVSSVKPKLVIACGEKTLGATVGRIYSRDIGDIDKWAGFSIPFYKWNCYVVHIYAIHDVINTPSFAKNERFKNANSITEKIEAISNNGMYRQYVNCNRNYIKEAFAKSRNPLPQHIDSLTKVVILNPKDSITYMKDAYRFLKNNPAEICEIDLETNSLRGFSKESKIYSASICYKDDESASFRITNENISAFTKFINAPFIKFCGHNAAFDYQFMRLKAGLEENINWLSWDTMLMAHYLWNKEGICSLKFQNLIYNGVGDYESDIKKYLESEGKSSNDLNKIEEAPEALLLLYGGRDTLYTRAIRKQQEPLFKALSVDNKDFANKILLKGSLTLAEMAIEGIPVDRNLLIEKKEMLEKKIAEIEAKYKADPLWKLWVETYKEKASIMSDTQIIEMLFNKLKLKPEGLLIEGKYKTDHEYLSKVKHPFVAHILEYRKYNKVLATYVLNHLNEMNDDGNLRCSYSQLIASYRTSSYAPSLQNISTRDSELAELCKSHFRKDDEELIEVDVQALEPHILVTYSKDDNLLKVLSDDSIDVHILSAKEAFILDDWKKIKDWNPKMFKMLRNAGKLCNLALGYGSYFTHLAEVTWQYMLDNDLMVDENTDMWTHLANKLGVKKEDMTDKGASGVFYKKFFDNMKNVQKAYWDRYKATEEWRKQQFEIFIKEGYITSKTGFMYKSPSSANACGNYPIQGSGSNMLMVFIMRIRYLAKKKGFKSRPCHQVHDSILLRIKDQSEREEFLKMVKHVMTVEVYDLFPWMKDIPFGVDFESTGVGGSWDKKKHIDV